MHARSRHRAGPCRVSECGRAARGSAAPPVPAWEAACSTPCRGNAAVRAESSKVRGVPADLTIRAGCQRGPGRQPGFRRVRRGRNRPGPSVPGAPALPPGAAVACAGLPASDQVAGKPRRSPGCGRVRRVWPPHIGPGWESRRRRRGRRRWRRPTAGRAATGHPARRVNSQVLHPSRKQSRLPCMRPCRP